MGMPCGDSFKLAICLSLTITGCASLVRTPERSCTDLGTAILIDTKREQLQLCQSGVPVREFGVAIGRGGRDKHSEGDKRTPLGGYELGSVRGSVDFHRFIPVGYPTAIQQAQGYTGAAIGIHGPPRTWKWLGRLTTWVNWTRGCIAVGRDNDIETIEKWVTENRVQLVFLY